MKSDMFFSGRNTSQLPALLAKFDEVPGTLHSFKLSTNTWCAVQVDCSGFVSIVEWGKRWRVRGPAFFSWKVFLFDGWNHRWWFSMFSILTRTTHILSDSLKPPTRSLFWWGLDSLDHFRSLHQDCKSRLFFSSHIYCKTEWKLEISATSIGVHVCFKFGDIDEM